MTTAIKPPSSATIPNGLDIPSRFVHGDAEKRAADAINDEALAIVEAIAELTDSRANALNEAMDTTVREVLQSSRDFQAANNQLVARITKHLCEVQQVLPSLLPGCRRAIVEAEQDYERAIDDLEKTFRQSGIDESSLPGGAAAYANMEGARELFRKRLQSEPPAMVAMGRLNKAAETVEILQSMLPRKASTEWALTYLKFPTAPRELPPIITKLFA